MEKRLALKIVSLLLRYPNDDFMRDLDTISACLSEGAGARESLDAFIRYLRGAPLIRLQETYTRTFDLNPWTSLSLGYQKWGEEDRRVRGLSTLNRIYRESGFEPAAGELPDHLPMVLEFLSICSDPAFTQITDEYSEGVSTLKTRLKGLGSPYAGLLEAAETVMCEWTRAGGHTK